MEKISAGVETHVVDIGGMQFGLEELPRNILNIKAIEELHVGENKFRIVPPEIGKMFRLQRLSLNYNQIRMMPDEMENLQALRYLDVSNNTLVSLPESVVNLPNLKEIAADYNLMRSLPSLVHLTALTSISVVGNRIASLESSEANQGLFKNLTALTSISVVGNRIASLESSEANQCAMLEHIWIAHNDMDPDVLPEWFYHRSQAETMFLLRMGAPHAHIPFLPYTLMALVVYIDYPLGEFEEEGNP
ncbi:hypothetical protein T484DRAFT_1778361 [Baffinella frigidus]|nr:hypothetical protein T484DRAFT_1778361 [Cryptophyta sp. CCMP2293]